jgi:hypothetical protein
MLIVAPEATPFAFVLARTEVGVVVVAPTLLVVGMSQPTNISAKAEDEIPSEIAQKQDKNRILPTIRDIISKVSDFASD